MKPTRHYPDDSRRESTGVMQYTWCGKLVPTRETSTIRRFVTCEECRKQAHINVK